MPEQRLSGPAALFYVYAHEDEALREQVEQHLALLQRQGLLLPWHDRQIEAGEDWKHAIDDHVEAASIILLLISPAFLASNYCYDIEMQRALERHQAGEARVIPLLLRPCDWHTAPFGHLQALPRDGQAITTWTNHDEAFLQVSQSLRKLLSQSIPTGITEKSTTQNRANMLPVGERTFTDQDVTARRRGKRAAYPSQPFLGYLDQTTPRHGERPVARAHLDHTQLDIQLVSSITGKPLAKPWATFLVDAYSRRVLACSVTYDPPSYRSAMMAFRLCVQRYGRLPQELVVDRGSEFTSVYFESLLARCFVTKLEQPPNQPHFGSVIERLFRTTTTELLNQLRGNTQASKVPRQMTRDVDPKRLAVWTLEQFARRLMEYVHEIYDQMEHPALHMSPREAYAQGMLHAGSRTHTFIPYSEAFLIQTRPSTRTGVVKIHLARGITANGLQYWHECMCSPLVAGRSVPVRYGPYNMGFAYVYIDDQWIECVADAFLQVHGRSEREWNVILDEWREHQRQLKRVTLNGPRLAKFLQELEKDEVWLLQRQRDLEEQPLREALLLPSSGEVERSAQEEPAPIELDLSKIPHYEVYQ